MSEAVKDQHGEDGPAMADRRKFLVAGALRTAVMSVPISVEELDNFTGESVRSKCSGSEHPDKT